MSILEKISLTLVFLTLKAGTFSFVYGGVRYNVVIVETEHAAPLGRFTLAQALSLVNKVASGTFDGITARIGADDYALTISQAG